MKTLIKVFCEFCKKEFDTSLSEYNKFLKGKKKHICCSRVCANRLNASRNKGTNNVNYKEKRELKCKYCGKIFHVKPSDNDAKFCKRECKDKYNSQQSRIDICCKTCGKGINITKYQYENGKVYCSKKCSNKSRETKVEKQCIICGSMFFTSFGRSEKSITCSRKCQAQWQSIYYTQLPDVQERLKQQGVSSHLSQNVSGTYPEQLVEKYFIENNINYIFQFVIGDRLIADFYLPKYNCVFEVYGDYWHANPQKYGDSLIPLNNMQKINKNKDIRRYKVITKKYNYLFYSMWEYDIKNNLNKSMERFFEYINNKIRNDYVS